MGSHFNVSWFWNVQNIKDIILLLGEYKKPLVHVCSGSSNIGDIRLDKSYINTTFKDGCTRFYDDYRGSANILGDMCNLPLKDGCAGTVLCDPPYDFDFTTNNLINELARISKPKTKIIFIAPWVPKSPVIQLKSHELWIVGKKKPYYKIASVFYKSNGQIGDYV